MKDFLDKIGVKKVIIGVTVFIVIILLFIIGAIIYNKFFYKKSYKEIESIMLTASQKYYEKNKDELPQSKGEIKTVTEDELVKGKYMKKIDEYLKDKTKKCSGKVNVTNINDKYRYIPILDCGEDYKVKLLSEQIKENEQIVTTGAGLYELNNELVFRGERINNNVTFARRNWKIVKITDNKVILILGEQIKNESNVVWDNRYNEEKKSNIGKNDYEISRIKESLEDLYNSNTLFTEEEKLLITTNNLYIGKRAMTDEDKTGMTEKQKILENQYIGRLSAYDYLNASIDENCKSIVTNSCNNYNYLTTYDSNWWLLTANKENTYEIYKIETTNTISSLRANTPAKKRPVIALAEDVLYESGNGSIETPYIIK